MPSKFGEFLYTLRKEKGMTQSELADKLGITNKAVSKWETGEAFPETGQLVPIASIFDITVDELLRGEKNTLITEEQPLPAQNTEKQTEPIILKPMTKGESFAIAGSVALILVGVLTLITLAVNNINYGIYVSILLFCVAVAVFFIVTSTLRRQIRSADITEQNAEHGKKLATMLAGGIGIIISSVGILIALFGLGINETIVLPVFFGVLIIGISIVVYSGIQWGNFAKSYSLPEEEEPVPAKYKKLEESLSGVIMLSAVAIFLLLGFLRNLWHIAWVVFPIGGILCGILNSVLKAINK